MLHLLILKLFKFRNLIDTAGSPHKEIPHLPGRHSWFTTENLPVFNNTALYWTRTSHWQKNILLQLQHHKIIPKNNNHIMQCNQEVLSWSKPIAKKAPSYGYDDNVGNDCLSSQSSYDQDISNQNFLHSIIPSQYLTYSTIDVAAELKGIYSSLFKAIHEIWLKLSNKTTLLAIDKKRSIVTPTLLKSKRLQLSMPTMTLNYLIGQEVITLIHYGTVMMYPNPRRWRNCVTVRLSQGCFQKKQHQLDINLWDLSLHTPRKDTTLLDFIRAHLWFFKPTSNTPTL